MGKENREKTLQAFKRARKVIAKFTNTYSISPALEKIAELSKKRINISLQDLFDPDAPEEKKAKAEDLIFSTYWATQPRQPGPAREFPPEIFNWLYDLCADVAERQLKKYREQRGRRRKHYASSPHALENFLCRNFINGIAENLGLSKPEVQDALIRAGLALREGGKVELDLRDRRASSIRDALVSYLTPYEISSLRKIRNR